MPEGTHLPGTVEHGSLYRTDIVVQEVTTNRSQSQILKLDLTPKETQEGWAGKNPGGEGEEGKETRT